MLGVSAERREITEINWREECANLMSNYFRFQRRRRAYDRFNAVNWHPSLSSILVSILINSRGMLKDQQVSRISTKRREFEFDAQGSKCKLLHSCRLIHNVLSVSSLSTELERGRENSLFGCHISVKNFILGGLRGKSCGKLRVARKKPPS